MVGGNLTPGSGRKMMSRTDFTRLHRGGGPGSQVSSPAPAAAAPAVSRLSMPACLKWESVFPAAELPPNRAGFRQSAGLMYAGPGPPRMVGKSKRTNCSHWSRARRGLVCKVNHGSLFNRGDKRGSPVTIQPKKPASPSGQQNQADFTSTPAVPSSNVVPSITSNVQ